MNYSIEDLRKQYFESIMLLTDEEDILNMLPQPGYDSFYQIINGVLELIEKEIHLLHGELHNLDDNEYGELINEELKLLNFKKDACQKLIEKASIKGETVEKNDEVEQVNLIFATTENGNVYVERDLKNIPEEYYDSIGECLKKIENGFEESNSEQAHQFTTTHKDLVGLHEIKDFKVRIMYKKLAPDLAYIIMFKIKKSDFSKLDQNEIVIRYKKIQDEYERLSEMIKNPLMKEELINYNNEISERIYGMMNENRRGRNV